MKFSTTTLLLFSMVATAYTSSVPKLHLMSRETASDPKNIITKEGCNVNVCFALDGSGSVNQTEFDLARFFVQDIVNIVGTDNKAGFAAVQFGVINYPIIPITDDNRAVALALERVQRVGDIATSVGAGIVYCDSQLARRVGDANKIVVLGDGRNNFGGIPVRRANNFRRRDGHGEVCAVGVGFKDTSQLLEVAGGDVKRLLTVDQYIDLQGLLRKLTLSVCVIEVV